MSPEMFAGEYNEKCDIWSSGVILHMMLTGSVPFLGSGINQIRAAVTSAKVDYTKPVWTNISPEGKDLLKKMLEPSYSKRLSAAQVIDHPWFNRHKAGTLSKTPLSEEALENLSKFHATNKLQKSILTFISTNIMNEESNKELADLFRSMDKNT